MGFNASDFPDLELKKLQKLVERFATPPNLILLNLFGSDKWDSDKIEWETQIGSRGLTPFVAPGVQSPLLSTEGTGISEAYAASWKEKMFFDEHFLNNLRTPGTREQHYSKQKRIAKETQKLKNRSLRRKEWMLAKMLTGGTMSYLVQNGLKYSLDYGIPSENAVSLASSRYWEDGSSRNIVEDIFDAQLTMSNANSGKLTNAIFTTEILKLMVFDPSIQTLLSKSSYGDGDLFARPVEVLGTLLGIPKMYLYDEQYQIKAWLTAVVTADSTVAVSVDDTTDFEVGETLYFYDVSAKTKEGETISSIDSQAGTVTVSTAPSTSYKANEDYVYMNKKFIPTTKFCCWCDQVEGEKIAEFADAPYGLDRIWGMKLDDHEEWDPDGIAIRCQNKGLPVLYQEDGVYILTVND